MSQITKNMTFTEMFEKFPEEAPQLAEVLMEAGLACVGCAAAKYESIEEGLSAHGFSEEAINKILEKLNSIISVK